MIHLLPAMILAPVGAALPALQGGTNHGDVHKATYRSDSGTWELEVTPSHRYGYGSAKYVLRRGAEEVWAGELKQSLRRAVLSEDGTFAGYAYCGNGLHESSDHHMHVLVVGPDGEVRLDDRSPLRHAPGFHMGSEPRAVDLHLDDARSRLLVQVMDSSFGAQTTQAFWFYSLSGEKLGEVVPDLGLPEEVRTGPLRLRFVAETPLTIVSALTVDVSTGSRFVLFDEDYEPVWSLASPRDYERDEDAPRWVNARGAVVETSANAFSIWLCAEGVRVDYHVLLERSTGKWTVEEKNRSPYDPRTALEPAAEPNLETFRPRLLGKSTLRAPEVERPAIRDITAFYVDADDRVHFVRRESEVGFSSVVVDSVGRTISEVPIDPFEPSIEGSWEWTVARSGRGLYAVEAWENEGPMHTWQVDLTTGAATYLGPLECPKCPFHGISLGDDGSFAAIGYEGESINSGRALRRFTADGELSWKVGGSYDPRDESSLLGTQDVLLRGDGSTAVLSTIPRLIQVWNADGSFRHTIDLEDRLGQKPNYPSKLHRDMDGGMLLEDFNGDPPLWRLGPDGAVRSNLDSGYRFLRVAPSGEIWASDLQRFFVLDDQGQVTRTLGEVLPPNELQKPWSESIDSFGRILVRDQISKAVHVFGRNGERSFVCEPSDEDRESFLYKLAVGPNGDVYLSLGESRSIHFDPTGERMGLVDWSARGSAFLPGTHRRWQLDRQGLRLVDREGNVLAEHRSRPDDGRWLETYSQLAVTPDGRAVVYSDGIALFSAEGDPIETLLLPDIEDFPRTLVCASNEWALLGRRGSNLALVSFYDGRIVILELPEVEREGWTLGFSPEGDELWCVLGRELRTERYSLPE